MQPATASPIFLLAPPRSCSTVTVAMLAQHPQIYGFPELLLFTAPTVGALLGQRQEDVGLPDDWIERRLSGLYRAVAEVHRGSQDPAAIDWARAWLAERAHWPTSRLMRHLVEAVRPRVALEKSPETVTRDGALERCMTAFPDARYIHLTRHPAATVRSMKENWRTLFTGLDAEAFHALCVRAWCLAHLRILRALEKVPPRNRMRIKAEDVLRDPEGALSQVVRRLGLDWNETIAKSVRSPERWRFGGLGPAGRLYGGDWKFLTSPALRTPQPEEGSAAEDLGRGLEERPRAALAALMRRLGYT
ncbi:sulfotransferase family protein [Thermostaphylospora chromogena]|nr:sulfotransferase [Thermostaphylospora chromogena]